MGKHSSPEQGPFYRSFVAWLFPWILIGLFVLAAVWVAVDVVGKDDTKITPTARSDSQTPLDESPEPPVSESPDPVASETPEPEPEETAPADDGNDKPLITDDVTVQVLNGTGSTEADDRMADRLSSLGYDVVAVQGSSKQYPQTTVFWSFPGAQDAAERLAERFGWVAAQKPSNLSSTVDLHVVVGADEV